MKVNDVNKVIKELANLKYKKGYSRKSMIEYLQSTYKLKISRCYALIEQMLKETAEAYMKVNEDALYSSIAFLEELQEGALRENNKRLALEIQKEINKLLELSKNELEIKGLENIEIIIKRNEDRSNTDL